MKKFLVIFFLIFYTTIFSQNRGFTKKLKAGKTYCLLSPRDFIYNEKFKGSIWKEVDETKLISNKKSEVQKKLFSTETQKARIKLVKYKEKLISLGYKIKATNYIDMSFIKAHNKYLRKKKREERKRLKNKV